jgi:hypothetical protein
VLSSRIKTVHPSDFKEGKVHVLIGERELDLAGFLYELVQAGVSAITLESSLSSIDMPDCRMSTVCWSAG